jgi:predicted MFS family arabinose efflux permease
MRGRFLASRNLGQSIATLATAPLAGFLIDSFTGFGGWQLVWVVAFTTGVLSTWCYARIPEPAPHPKAVEEARTANERGLLADIVNDRNFLVYLASIAVWNVSLYAAGPFFNVYLVKELNASTAMVGFLSALPSLSGLLGFALFGRLMDRKGTRWMMVMSGLMIPLLPLAWIVVTAAWQVAAINLMSGLMWAAYNLALMNMVMVMAPPEKRARYAAVFQTVTFAATFAGPLIGGVVIDQFGFYAVFALSGIGRLAGTGILIRVKPDASETALRAPQAASA